jgi:hypothetical protein
MAGGKGQGGKLRPMAPGAILPPPHRVGIAGIAVVGSAIIDIPIHIADEPDACARGAGAVRQRHRDSDVLLRGVPGEGLPELKDAIRGRTGNRQREGIGTVGLADGGGTKAGLSRSGIETVDRRAAADGIALPTRAHQDVLKAHRGGKLQEVAVVGKADFLEGGAATAGMGAKTAGGLHPYISLRLLCLLGQSQPICSHHQEHYGTAYRK